MNKSYSRISYSIKIIEKTLLRCKKQKKIETTLFIKNF